MRKLPVILLAVVCVMLLVGQCLAYYIPKGGSSISTDTDGDRISYSVDPEAPFQCMEIHLTHAGDISRYYVLVDDGYRTAIDSKDVRPTLYFLEKAFGRCPGISLEVKNAAEIKDLLDSGAHDFGLLFFTGAIPEILYDGTMSSPLIQWLTTGGYVIWSGDMFGRLISEPGDTREVPGYHTTVSSALFGAENVFNPSSETTYGQQRINIDLTSAVGL